MASIFCGTLVLLSEWCSVERDTVDRTSSLNIHLFSISLVTKLVQIGLSQGCIHRGLREVGNDWSELFLCTIAVHHSRIGNLFDQRFRNRENPSSGDRFVTVAFRHKYRKALEVS